MIWSLMNHATVSNGAVACVAAEMLREHDLVNFYTLHDAIRLPCLSTALSTPYQLSGVISKHLCFELLDHTTWPL